MREFSSRNKGFISAYFLLMLGVVSTWMMILVSDTDHYLKAVSNMEENSRYYINEAIVISDIKCRINEGIENGSYEKNGVSYYVEVFDNCLYVTVYGEMKETMLLQISETDHFIISCSYEREAKAS